MVIDMPNSVFGDYGNIIFGEWLWRKDIAEDVEPFSFGFEFAIKLMIVFLVVAWAPVERGAVYAVLYFYLDDNIMEIRWNAWEERKE